MTISPLATAFHATLSPPGSKSLTNRALVLAALADGQSVLHNILLADDTRVMLDSLERLGFQFEIDHEARILSMRGEAGKIPASSAELMCGNSGTTIRFLSALCSLAKGDYVLDGVARMRERPIGQLVDLLRGLGTRIEYLGTPGFPPLRILADTLPGGLLHFGAALSSQFLSALLMVSPYTRHEMRIDLAPSQTSWPYVAMTMRMMDQFGHTPELARDPLTGDPQQIIVPRGNYAPTHYLVEPDASNATYFLATAAIHPGSSVRITGLGKTSLQGDVGFAAVLGQMGADVKIDQDAIQVTGTGDLRGIDISLASMPDTAQTLAVAALYAKGATTIRGLHTLRVKETDRLAALSNELTKLGARVDVSEDSTLTIEPPKTIVPDRIDTYDDHRMAMSFALAATRTPGVIIRDAECVNKTYPEFFEDLRRMLASS